MGIIGATLLAAIAAAVFAKQAADHTETGAKAAERQTELVAATQRAWISISAEVTAIRKKDSNIVFTIILTFKNIGQTVAKNVKYYGYFLENTGEAYGTSRIMFNNEMVNYEGFSIIPGDTRTFRMDVGRIYEAMKRLAVDGRYAQTVFALCDYKTETDEVRHETDNCFALMMRDRESILEIGISVDPIPTAEEVALDGGSLTAT